jgi:hypothetical protein
VRDESELRHWSHIGKSPNARVQILNLIWEVGRKCYIQTYILRSLFFLSMNKLYRSWSEKIRVLLVLVI